MVEFKYIDHNYIKDQAVEQNKEIYKDGGYSFTPYQNDVFHQKYAHNVIYDEWKPIIVQIFNDSDITIHHTINFHQLIQNMDKQQKIEFLSIREIHYFRTYQEAEDFIENIPYDEYFIKSQQYKEIDWDF